MINCYMQKQISNKGNKIYKYGCGRLLLNSSQRNYRITQIPEFYLNSILKKMFLKYVNKDKEDFLCDDYDSFISENLYQGI